MSSGASRAERIPFAGGWEWDAFTRWRKVMSWRAGALAYVKRGYRRRARRSAALAIRSHIIGAGRSPEAGAPDRFRLPPRGAGLFSPET